ncbi:hypothetical protein [Alphaproteobacteria bacterium endosymbiont of Tiliacea citrago]|uniref:hypothetical protein n=1 Tax=Alphaproteobacteria bacterium endosymbiont of Tiliacea citrago TaxID=3077944 RepID=UPI00313D935A
MQFFKSHCCNDDVILIKVKSFDCFCFDNISLITNRFTGIGANYVLLFNESNDFKIFNSDGHELAFCESAIACFVKYLNCDYSVLNSQLGKILVKNLEEEKTLIELPKKFFIKKTKDFFILEHDFIKKRFFDHLIYKFFIVDDCSKINLEIYRELNFVVSFLSHHNSFWNIRTIKPNQKESFSCCSTAFVAYNLIIHLGHKNFYIKYNNQKIFYKTDSEKTFQVANTQTVAEIKVLQGVYE